VAKVGSRCCGIDPSFGFLREPETNDVAERFNRTLKEQAIHGRVFRNIHEVRAAVGPFGETYNQHWLIAKLGYRSPARARHEFVLASAA
jgi:putative transposase